MTVVASQIMKYFRDFFNQLKICVTIPMGHTSNFSSYVTMISNFFIVMINKFFANPTTVTWLKLFFFFFTYDQIFLKVFFYYLFTTLILLRNCFNKFISTIFTSKINNWLTKSIINTNNFLSKTTRNVILIFFLCKNLHKLQRFLNYTKNRHKF